MRVWIPIALLLLLLSASACARNGDAGDLPAAAPTLVRRALNAVGVEPDSPRVTPSPDARVPPTWTPVPRATAPPVLATRTPESNPPPGITASQGEVYTVVAGDTLASVAEQFAVDLSLLAASNGLLETATLQPGQLLLIPR
jgi:LysM repeat protein